jgi:DNA-binding LacI/PurR family transcriptional regulator
VRLVDERIDLLREAGLPFTLIGQTQNTQDLSYVDIDFEATVREAVRHLTELGHTQIALLTRSESEFIDRYGPTVRVNDAFAAVMAQRGLTPRALPCADDPEAGRVAFADFLDDSPDLSAINSMNDRATVGVIDAIEGAGWSVPGDFSVMSLVTSATVAQLSRPRLTTLAPQTALLSRRAVHKLVAQIEGTDPPDESPLLPCLLDMGASTGPKPHGRNIAH